MCQDLFFHIVSLLLGLFMGECNKAEEVLNHNLVLSLFSAQFLCVVFCDLYLVFHCLFTLPLLLHEFFKSLPV